MKFTIQREAILKPLQVVGSVVERRQTLPILSNVLLEISPRGMALTATDLEVEIVVSASQDNAEGGRDTFPARKFIAITRALPAAVLPNGEDFLPTLSYVIEQS